MHSSDKNIPQKRPTAVLGKDDSKVIHVAELQFEKDGGVSTRRQQKLAMKQNENWTKIGSTSFDITGATNPAMTLRSDDRLHEVARPAMGYSMSRSSAPVHAASKGNQSMVNPSSSNSRSRGTEQYEPVKVDEISIKF